MAPVPTDAVVGTTVAVSFILLTVFPGARLSGAPSRATVAGVLEHGQRLLSAISTLSIFTYGYAGYATYVASTSTSRDWRMYALAATCHLLTAVHSAVNMQPINAKLDALREPTAAGVDTSLAEYYARRWIKLNVVRILMPLVAGTAALWQTLRHA